MNEPVAADNEQARIAHQVQAFYDAHPYPPPVTDLDHYRRMWDDLNRRRADYHLYWPTKPYRENESILVAGCGTSQAAKHALRHPNSRVVGIDVGSTSLQQTEILKRKYKLDNLEIHQLAIELAHELNQTFDRVVCTGVLHHMADPQAGLVALRDVLAPDGAMHLMVYASYGRAGIYMLQEYCRRLGIGTSDEEIQDLANTLMTLPQGHPMARLLGESADFRSSAGLADALLNPQDRAFTVPQFFEFIDQAGLRFGRWVRQGPYQPSCGVVANTPHGSRLTRLATPEQYAAMELFRGTMVRHSAVVFRDDQPEVLTAIQFDDECWLEFVPIKLPYTICIEERERMPPGASAVLINQSHNDPDLFLPIDAAEKRLLDTIDGKLSIIEIIRRLGKSPGDQQIRESARAFFQRLWQYDQVVFDASNIPTELQQTKF